MNNLEKQLRQLVDGRITFASFATHTRREYERMALYLLRKWTAPAWYVPEDVIQDLYIGTWIWVWSFDPTRGPSLSKFVVFNSMTHAKRALHKARGAKLSGSADKNPSRFERPLSSFGDDDEHGGGGSSVLEALMSEEPIAESVIIEAEERDETRRMAVADLLGACETELEAKSIRAIAEAGTVDGGGRILYDDLEVRFDHRLGSEEQATRLAARTAHGVVGRAGMIHETLAL